MKPVTVVIPALNAERTIGETLKALRVQVGVTQFEIIVADNGSGDRTPEIARAEGATIVRELVRGPAAARNAGLLHASGEIVAHLDADTVPSRRWLAQLCAPFDDPSVVIVAGNTVCYPPTTAAERYAQAMGLQSAERAIQRAEFPFAPSVNMAVRRDAALRVGGWAQDLMTGEDVDFSYRILKTYGTSIVYAERALLYHHARANEATLRAQAAAYGAGAADLYRRYPEEVRWNAAKTVRLSGMLIGRIAASLSARIGGMLGVIDPQRAEFLHYHALWTTCFWQGFARRFLTYRRGTAS